MLLLIAAFIAGLLTALAPCVLPLLPVIIGGSIGNGTKSAQRPLIVAASLAVSLMVFTILLKATSLLIAIPPRTFTTISGDIVVALGIFLLFPQLYSTLTTKLGIEQASQQLLSKSGQQSSVWSAIITGAALGPVFSSCSPVYAYILATILPISFLPALVYMASYILGLSLMLLLIGYLGQKLINKVKFAANPRGIFQRSLAVIFIVVGLLIISGYNQNLQTWVSAHTPFNFDTLSAKLIPNSQPFINSQVFNVAPYAAPEFADLSNWINSNPTTLKQLRGQVVLIDFWTYSCINCIRSVPYLEDWYQQYKDDGLVVIGVHAPEFAFEKKLANVSQAVEQQGINYPVALDNGFKTWNAFHNQYWPAHYLIDAQGQVRRIHYGEGEYEQTEVAIRQLLQDNGATLPTNMVTTGQEAVPVSPFQTPETYLGSARANNYTGQPSLAVTTQANFSPSSHLTVNQWTLSGRWQVEGQHLIAQGDSQLTFRMAAKEVYLVAGSAMAANVTVTLNGQPLGQSSAAGPDIHNSQATINEYRLYRLVSFDAFHSDSTIELTVPKGVQLNAFTFAGQ